MLPVCRLWVLRNALPPGEWRHMFIDGATPKEQSWPWQQSYRATDTPHSQPQPQTQIPIQIQILSVRVWKSVTIFFHAQCACLCIHFIGSIRIESNRIESKRIIRIAPWVCLRKRFEFIKIFVYLWLFLFSHFLLICKNSQRRQRISVLQMPKRQDKQKEEERKKRKEKKKNFKKEQRTQFVKIFILMAWRWETFLVCSQMHDLEILFFNRLLWWPLIEQKYL